MFYFPGTWLGRRRDTNFGLLHRQELFRGKNTHDVYWRNRRYVNLALLALPTQSTRLGWRKHAYVAFYVLHFESLCRIYEKVQRKDNYRLFILNFSCWSSPILLLSGCENPKPCQTELTVLEYGLYDGDPVTKVLLQPLTGNNLFLYKGIWRISNFHLI